MEEFNYLLSSKVNDIHDMLRFDGIFNAVIKSNLRDRMIFQKTTCFENHNKIAEDYAKCMYSLKKGMMDESRKFKFMSQFIKLKIESCIKLSNSEEREKCFSQCQTQAKKILETINNL